jgi:polyhydroxyalkanoate synthesis regulator phasin
MRDGDGDIPGELDRVGAAVGELTWDRGPFEEESVDRQGALRERLPEEGDDVREDESYSYDRKSTRWVGVGDRDQHPREYREVMVRDEVKRMALFGSGVAELTRHRAEQLARELLERSKQNRDEVMRLVRGEIQNQIKSLGVVSKRDVERLERRITRLEAQIKEMGQSKKKTTAKKTTAKKPAAKTSASSENS